MVLLNPVCDPRHPPTAQDRPVFSQSVPHETDGGRLPRPAQKKCPAPSAKPGFIVEPYSSSILRPLTAACVFRDCSRRSQASAAERAACRTLMRQAAIKWRHGLAMGDL